MVRLSQSVFNKQGDRMIFRQLFDQISCTYTYILAGSQGREAIIIDPVYEKTDQYVRLLNELGVKLAITLDTHVHADHVTGSGKLKERLSCAIAMGEKSKATCVTMRLKDGETLNAAGLKLRALYTPGHTDDSYSYVMDDRVFTGDTLLIRGTGRTDFQNGDARAAYDSLFNKLLKLKEDTFVYPAHDYKGETVSTIGEEKAYNPRLQVKSVQEYVDLMGNLNLPYPKMIDIAVRENLTCGTTYSPV